MKKFLFSTLLVSCTILSCKNPSENKVVTTTPPLQTAVPAPPPPPTLPTADTSTAKTAIWTKTNTQCFQLNFKKDLTSCQLTIDEKGGFVSGYFDWSPNEKDGGHGVLKNGKMVGNMLTADWVYMIEGSVQTEEVYLKVESDKVTKMRTELVEKGGKLVAKDKSKLAVEDVLKKVECSKLDGIVKNIKAFEKKLK